MNLRPQCGIAGPKLLYPDGTIQHAGIEIPRGTIGRHRLARSDANAVIANCYEKVKAVTGAVFCIRSKMMRGIGAFDDDYKFGCEDTAYCLRAGCLGWEVWYVPDSVVMHREGAVRRESNASDRLRTWINQSHDKFRREWGALVDICEGEEIASALKTPTGEWQ